MGTFVWFGFGLFGWWAVVGGCWFAIGFVIRFMIGLFVIYRLVWFWIVFGFVFFWFGWF